MTVRLALTFSLPFQSPDGILIPKIKMGDLTASWSRILLQKKIFFGMKTEFTTEISDKIIFMENTGRIPVQ